MVISITILNSLPIVLLPTVGTNKKRLVYLIDTGSDISVVKRKFLNINSVIHDTKMDISGIVDSTISAQGSTMLNIELIDSLVLKYQFHIVDEINVPYDGIIGNDLLTHFRAIMNYHENTITVPIMLLHSDTIGILNHDFTKEDNINEILSVNVNENLGIETQQSEANIKGTDGQKAVEEREENSQEIPSISCSTTNSIAPVGHINCATKLVPRMVQTVSIATSRTKTCLIQGGKIKENVFIGHSVSQPRDGKILVSLINSGNEEVEITPESVDERVLDLDDYEILDHVQYEQVTNRLSLLEENLNLQKLTEE